MKRKFILLPAALFAVTCVAGIVEDSGIKGGIIVSLGVDSGKNLEELLVNDRFMVHGLEQDAGKVEKAREYLHGKGLYGKISVSRLDGDTLPYGDHIVNLLVDNGDMVGAWETLLYLVLGAGSGLLVYAGTLWLLKMSELRELFSAVRDRLEG